MVSRVTDKWIKHFYVVCSTLFSYKKAFVVQIIIIIDDCCYFNTNNSNLMEKIRWKNIVWLIKLVVSVKVEANTYEDGTLMTFSDEKILLYTKFIDFIEFIGGKCKSIHFKTTQFYPSKNFHFFYKTSQGLRKTFLNFYKEKSESQFSRKSQKIRNWVIYWRNLSEMSRKQSIEYNKWKKVFLPNRTQYRNRHRFNEAHIISQQFK